MIFWIDKKLNPIKKKKKTSLPFILFAQPTFLFASKRCKMLLRQTKIIAKILARPENMLAGWRKMWAIDFLGIENVGELKKNVDELKKNVGCEKKDVKKSFAKIQIKNDNFSNCLIMFLDNKDNKQKNI